MQRASWLYFGIVTLVSAAIFWLLHLGSALPAPGGNLPALVAHAPAAAPAAAPAGAAWQALGAQITENLSEPLSHLFLQLLIIIGASRVAGVLFERFGQPAVVGEMAAGILLGPSLFGLLAPGAFAFVFPPASFGTLRLLSQVGVCLFMFTVGMELNVNLVRKKARTAVLVSHASILIPYFLGVVLAYFLYSGFAQPGCGLHSLCSFHGHLDEHYGFPSARAHLARARPCQNFAWEHGPDLRRGG
jgi:hypothetical protein